MTYSRLFAKFGDRIYRQYERRPLLMNSVVGATVYLVGELAVQRSGSGVADGSVNLSKCCQLGTLGAVENGILMSYWYRFLSLAVGASVTTEVVLLKCAFDQAIFATQQDGIFLGLCAFESYHDFKASLDDLRETFLTTWINDCSIWPVVNFFGFAFVPLRIQPTFMSIVQLFWQFYISSVATSLPSAKVAESDKPLPITNECNSLKARTSEQLTDIVSTTDKAKRPTMFDLEWTFTLSGIPTIVQTSSTLQTIPTATTTNFSAHVSSTTSYSISSSHASTLSSSIDEYIASHNVPSMTTVRHIKHTTATIAHKPDDSVQSAVCRLQETEAHPATQTRGEESSSTQPILRAQPTQNSSQSSSHSQHTSLHSSTESPHPLRTIHEKFDHIHSHMIHKIEILHRQRLDDKSCVDSEQTELPAHGCRGSLATTTAVSSIPMGTTAESQVGQQASSLMKQKQPASAPSQSILAANSDSMANKVSSSNDYDSNDDDGKNWLKARAEAVRNAQVGGTVLFILAAVRKLYFKI